MTSPLLEALHSSLQHILDNSTNKEVFDKFDQRNDLLNDNSINSGIENNPDKGSSRTVFHVKEPKEITIDGKNTVLPTVIKIAKEHPIDEFNDTGKPLGVHQNEREANDSFIAKHSILTPTKNGYVTNKEGVFAPVLGTDINHNHVEMGKVAPFNHEDFDRYTHGLHHYGMVRVIQAEMNKDDYVKKSMGSSYNSILNHPFTQKVLKAAKDTNMSANDIGAGNWGIFVHPITKEHIPVISDYGMSPEIENHYKRFQQKYHEPRNYVK